MQDGAEKEKLTRDRKSSLEAAALVLLCSGECLMQAVILKVIQRTEPRNSLQTEMEGRDDGFTANKQQMGNRGRHHPTCLL